MCSSVYYKRHHRKITFHVMIIIMYLYMHIVLSIIMLNKLCENNIKNDVKIKYVFVSNINNK